MPIKQTPLYICDSCEYTNSNPFLFRIIGGDIKVGNQTLVKGSTFDEQVLCLDCFCDTLGIDLDKQDKLCEDERFERVHPQYQGDDKNKDQFYEEV